MPEKTDLGERLKVAGSGASDTLQLRIGPILTKNTQLLIDTCRNIGFTWDE